MKQDSMEVYEIKAKNVPGLGKRIRDAREADCRTLADICRAIKMSTANWYRIEEEKQKLPIETLRKIEQVLGVDLGVSLDD